MKILIGLLSTLFLLTASNAHSISQGISCGDSVKSLGKTNASSFIVACPSGCTNGSVWGSSKYTTDSKICKAAIHGGAIGSSGGEVKVRVVAGQSSYAGSTRNGITTSKWGPYDKSFTVSKVGKQAMKISCADSVKSLNKTSASSFTAICPSGCTSGSVWGSKFYTTDSKICKAAIHDGVIGSSGGWVKVKLEPGKAKYTGTTQHSIITDNWGPYDQSFTVWK